MMKRRPIFPGDRSHSVTEVSMNGLCKILACGIVAAATFATIIPPAAQSGVYNLTVDRVKVDTGEFTKMAIGLNGAIPSPVLRFKEGEEVTINVTNNLDESISVHWHGLILPFQQDGVPTISYDGIAPGETFTYKFPIKQSGTYWSTAIPGSRNPTARTGRSSSNPRAGNRSAIIGNMSFSWRIRTPIRAIASCAISR